MMTPSKQSNPDPGTARPKPPSMNIEQEGLERPRRLMKAKDIARKIKSFDHFIHLWGEKARYYLPPKRCLTWHYVSQILCNEKRLLKLDQVGHIAEIPKMHGAVIKDMWNSSKNINSMHLYFPDINESQQVPRDYFFNVS